MRKDGASVQSLSPCKVGIVLLCAECYIQLMHDRTWHVSHFMFINACELFDLQYRYRQSVCPSPLFLEFYVSLFREHTSKYEH